MILTCILISIGAFLIILERKMGSGIFATVGTFVTLAGAGSAFYVGSYFGIMATVVSAVQIPVLIRSVYLERKIKKIKKRI